MRSLRIGTPVARPGIVPCVGLNHAAHAAESGSPPPDHDEGPDPQALGLRSRVDGEPRQSSSTSDTILDVATPIHLLGRVTLPKPGDIVNTGTAEGVTLSGRFPHPTEGDLAEADIDGLGRQTQKAVRA
ncbi:fumarylacetoacetate hydrolase family protein [Embleya scabrispora]|uniref:fumarylacetoacetate hydrolase family protein n=1 Tax=Embleya scabrispora TaxID=159449 RepID=UPI0003A6E697|nr:fumarylacetoacetate hydrolase family protein [Embleya scabrispora]MYS80550.1 hypothetical protein [Streptomyces sp. SID5474]